MITTDDFQRIVRLSPDDTVSLWTECGPRPEFWIWFLKREVSRELAHWARSVGTSEQVEAWQRFPTVANLPGHLVVPVVPFPSKQDQFHWRLAAPSFGLPIQWTRSGHGEGLPNDLVATAQQVRDCLAESPRLREQDALAGIDRCGVRWSGGWSDVDLSGLKLHPESAWAPLAIGLISLLRNRTLSNRLFVTGYWDREVNRWAVRASTLPHKLESARDWGRTLFAVPSGSLPFVLAAVEDSGVANAKCVGLRDSATDLAEGVRPALALAGIEPDDSRESKVNWYLDCATTNEAREYYESQLLDEIVQHHRAQEWHVAHQDLFAVRPKALVSIVSNSPELVKLAVVLFRPESCHLIYTQEEGGVMERFYEQTASWMLRRNTDPAAQRCAPVPHAVHDSAAALGTLAGIVTALERTPGAGPVLIDMTPGRRPMSMALLEGSRQGDRVLCWWTDTDRLTRRAVPFTEFPLLWEITAERVLKPLISPAGAETERRDVLSDEKRAAKRQ